MQLLSGGEKMNFFSIIVPIYNVEKYIDECIESVLRQEYINYELILVDDGSLDNSGIICENYSKNNKNIIVIHKKNGGVSDARNEGIKIAKGNYIIFLDGDDVLYNNCLKQINKVLYNKNIDILTCNFNKYGKEQEIYNFDIKTINSINDYLDILTDIPWAPWRNVFKTEILKKNNIYFEKDLICAEDCDFFMRFIDKAQKVLYTNLYIVNYRVNRDGSITNLMSYNAINGQFKIFSKNFYKYIERKNIKITKFFAEKYLSTITCINENINKKQLEYICEEIHKNKIIFEYAKGVKYKGYKIIWKIFGYKIGTKIIQLLRKLMEGVK